MFSVIATNHRRSHKILKNQGMPRFGRLSVLDLSAYVGNLAVSLLRAYIIVYEVGTNIVTVLAVFHSARDLARALRDRRKELEQ